MTKATTTINIVDDTMALARGGGVALGLTTRSFVDAAIREKVARMAADGVKVKPLEWLPGGRPKTVRE